MASVDDVLRFLARRVTESIYPDGTALPGTVNAPVKVYPGWPVPGLLQPDIDAGSVHISVWPLPTERRVNTPLGRPFRPVRGAGDRAGKAVRELKRQIKDFQITVWAPTPELREQAGTATDAALSAESNIDLGDGAPAQLFYVRQFDSDSAENWHVYRRDLFFSVNFATTQTITAPEVIQTVVTLNNQQAVR
ncbi:hypothetical protein [Pantoea piersonii]|jgi:hypothetical protein|uniref:hypothetical protein n=1 Tax=Pantoea piersonii TaxID=2364647 RepID=UPI000EA19AC1|nr:hypothetical protein [Pantoea piersonii]MBZ6386794.1 hypothetical protein [Pantoea piersonii]MBZ6400057.1 hypothetical protein [Pantoea piersonii]MBZ6409111.1 hypothetical protein [Pantoea piersonii]MBZ6426108.1 hypothetical protein [Pantoea piersonii]NYB04667.1 hypothetical protein [Pantoea piersonii]